jgi:beta-glucosidase/6-phospho-beta-glucosidase/beta-galactosidase
MPRLPKTPEEMTPDFVRFADVCFARYGDRVKHWCGGTLYDADRLRLTINEPLTTTNIGVHSIVYVSAFQGLSG